MFELDNVKNAAILRDLLNVWTWQRQKRSNSARLPQCLNLTTSKTKQFCETSSFSKLTTSKTKQFCETFSFFEVENIKNKTILRDVLQKWKVECRADGLVPMRFAIFPVHLSEVLLLPRKSDCRSYEVLHLSRKIISANLKISGSKMQPLSGNQRPDLLTALMKMSLVLCLPRKMHLSTTPAIVFGNATKTFTFCSLLTRSTIPCACETTSERPKVVRSWCALLHFDFEMCFAPQRRALFRHLHFQKWSGAGVFWKFWLGSVLRATTACTFSTSQLPKVVRSWCALYILTLKCASRHNGMHFFDIATSKVLRTCGALYILTWKCASRHNGVQFFISHPARWLRTRRFSEPTSRPSGQCFATFLPSRAPASSFFWLSLLWSSLFCSSLFYSSLLSDSSHLCFSSVHIVRSLTSKLPSIIHIYTHIHIYITCTSMCMYGKVMNCCIWMMM